MFLWWLIWRAPSSPYLAPGMESAPKGPLIFIRQTMKSSDLLPAIGFTTSLLRQNSCRITHACNVPCNDATWFGVCVCVRVCYNFTPPLMYHIKAQCPEQRKQNHFPAIVGRQMKSIFNDHCQKRLHQDTAHSSSQMPLWQWCRSKNNPSCPPPVRLFPDLTHRLWLFQNQDNNAIQLIQFHQ